MKKLLWTLSVIALASCGGDDDNAVTPQPEKPRMLTVVVSENPLQDENASSREALRRTAAATTTASLSSFILNYTADYYPPFTKTDNTWSTYSWPLENTEENNAKKLDFYANDGGSFVWISGDPYVSFTMDEDPFNQKDLLVAKTTTAYNDHGGQVYLTFDHACAAVQFNVYQEETATTYVVKNIKLQNVKNTGDYHYSDNSWKSVSGTTFYTLTNADITVTSDYQLLPCQWLFVIPQDKSGLTLEIKYTKGGGETTKNLTLGSGSWQAGKKYTVNIRIGGKAAS